MARVVLVLTCVFSAVLTASGRRTFVPRGSTLAVGDAADGAAAASGKAPVGEARRDLLAKARSSLEAKTKYAADNDTPLHKVSQEDATAEDDQEIGFFQATAMILSPESLLLFSLVLTIGSYFGLFELRSKAEILMDSKESNDEKIARLQKELAAGRTAPPASSGDSQAEHYFMSFQTSPEEQQAAKLRELFDLAKDEGCLSELLADAVSPPKSDDELSQRTDSLPALASFRDAVIDGNSKDFSLLGDEIVFDRCYVLKGAVPVGRTPEEALQSISQRVDTVSTLGQVKLFLQPAHQPGMSLLVAVLDSDLPSKQLDNWQWITFAVLLLCTIFSANNLSFLVIASENLNLDVYTILGSTIPAAAIVLAVALAQEGSRRLMASRYGVELSAPYFLPAFPFAPIGTFGALTQRLSASPNKTAEFNMSAAASLAGYIISFAAIATGVALGPDLDNNVYTVSLNYQLLPALLRAIVRPFLGAPSAVDMDTMDPVTFPANPILIGGLVGAFVNSLLLLPVGDQDGGILARLAFGDFSNTLGTFAYILALVGFLGGGEAGQTYVVFALTLLIFRSNLPEVAPKDCVTDISGAQKAAAVGLVALGVLLSFPGWPFPYV